MACYTTSNGTTVSIFQVGDSSAVFERDDGWKHALKLANTVFLIYFCHGIPMLAVLTLNGRLIKVSMTAGPKGALGKMRGAFYLRALARLI